jgi:apolipoprotein N-acyltransferase
MDPYSDNFMNSKGEELPSLSAIAHVKKFTRMADKVMDNKVDWLLMHETALPKTETNSSIYSSPSIQLLKKWISVNYPNTSILTGLAYHELKTTKEVNQKEVLPPTFKRTYNGTYYEYFNSSILINRIQDTFPQYHKSRLVIGVERIPSYFVYFQKYLTDFDSDSRAMIYNPNNATQTDREVFYGLNDSSVIAPVICYESVFGEYVTDYVNKGANFIGIITNDSWWGNTPGFEQHWSFARLRAIETRRSVARSANTGASGFINQRGDELQKSVYLTPDCLREKIKCNDRITFYVKYGDVIGKTGLGLAIMILLNLIVRKLIHK